MTTDLTGSAAAPVSPVEGTKAPEVAKTETPQAKDPNAARWAHMAKQQKALRAEQARFQQEKAAVETQRREIEAARQEIESVKSWKQRLANKDYDVLSEAGVSNEDLTQFLVNQPNPTERQIRLLEQKIADLQGKQDNTQKAMEEQTQRQYDQAIQQITAEVKGIVAADSKRYEMIHANDAHEAAVELIKQTFDTEGRMISIEEACNEVEEFLLDETIKLMKLEKVKGKFAAPEPVKPQFIDVPKGKRENFTVAARAAAEAQPTARTLTHAQTAAAPSKSTWAEKRQRAIAIMEGRIR